MQERHVIHQRCVYLSCQSLGSSTAHLTAALASFVLSVFSLSPWLRTAIHHSLRFFHLCVLCSPLIYCWTCLQNGPGAFHSVKKRKEKGAPVSEKSTFRNRENSSSICIWTLHSETRRMAQNYLGDTLFVMHGAAQWLLLWHDSHLTIWNRTGNLRKGNKRLTRWRACMCKNTS